MGDNNEIKHSYSDVRFFEEMDKKEQLTAKYLEELNADEAFVKYVNGFRGDAQESFKMDFAKFKADYELNKGDVFFRKKLFDNHFFNIAENAIYCIQQKKLFDAQCKWRAGLIEIPGITISYEFAYWGENIKRCKFISPINASEIKILEAFLLSNNNTDSFFTNQRWQDYDAYKQDALNNEGDSTILPSWYQFYDEQLGNENLLFLQDKKSELEKLYIELAKKENRPELSLDEILAEEQMQNMYSFDPNLESLPHVYRPRLTQPNDKRPFLDSNFEGYGKFIDQFENEHLKQVHQLRKSLNEDFNNIEEEDRAAFQEALNTMNYLGNEFPMLPNDNWIKGTIALAEKGKANKTAAELAKAFKEYEQGLLFDNEVYLNRTERYKVSLAKEYCDILKGLFFLGKNYLKIN